MEHIES